MTSPNEPSEARYSLRTGPSVRRMLPEKLPSHVAFAVEEFIRGPLLVNPHRVGKMLLRPPLQGSYSARRGTYRVVYDIDDDIRTVTVLAIEHHADVYRTR